MGHTEYPTGKNLFSSCFLQLTLEVHKGRPSEKALEINTAFQGNTE